jgi:Flp pilus assembly protein TadD
VALSRTGRIAEALGESENAIGLDPTNSYTHYARSLVLIRAGRPSAALQAVREAVRIDVTNPEYYLILAALLFDRREWNRSLGALDQALALDPRHVRCLNLRARTLLQLGRRGEAERTIKSALAAGPESADAHYGQGLLLLTRAQSGEALDHLLEARRLSPLTRNDCDRIALAYGRHLVPLRWIARWIPHWDVWHPKATWAYFMALILTAHVLDDGRVAPATFNTIEMIGQARPLTLFLAAAVILTALPFSFDALALGAAQILRHRWDPSRPGRPIGDALAVPLKFLMLIGLVGFANWMAVMLAIFPLFVLFLFACGACTTLAINVLRSAKEMRLTFVAYSIYAGLQIVAWFGPYWEFGSLPGSSLASIAIFAAASFFSDDVSRKLRQWER